MLSKGDALGYGHPDIVQSVYLGPQGPLHVGVDMSLDTFHGLMRRGAPMLHHIRVTSCAEIRGVRIDPGPADGHDHPQYHQQTYDLQGINPKRPIPGLGQEMSDPLTHNCLMGKNQIQVALVWTKPIKQGRLITSLPHIIHFLIGPTWPD